MFHNLDVPKLMSYHKLSQKADLTTLNAACLQLAKENFTDIAHSQWFLGLTIHEAHDYLHHDDLNVTTEDDALFAALRWLKNSNETRTVFEHHTKRQLQCVRLKFCQRSTLESLSNDDTVMDSLRLKLLEFLHHGRHREGDMRKSYSAAHSVSTPSTKLPSASAPGTGTREKLPSTTKATSKKPSTSSKAPSTARLLVPSPLKMKEEVLVVGGRETGNKRHKNIIFLDKDPKDCIMTEAPMYLGNSSVCALSKNAIIVSGGYDKSTSPGHSITKVQKFTITDHRWVDLPDLLFPVDCHGSAYANGKLYSIGGRYMENEQIKHRYSSINVLNLASLSWEEGQSLPAAVSGPGIATIEENIYSIGGHTGKEWSCQTVKLNTRTGTITLCQSIPKGDNIYNSTVGTHQHIYTLTSTLFLQYDVTKDQWLQFQLPMKPSHKSTMVLKESYLLVLGGFTKDDENPNDVIQKYDLFRKRWSLEARKMPLPLSQHWAFVMDIP